MKKERVFQGVINDKNVCISWALQDKLLRYQLGLNKGGPVFEKSEYPREI